MEIWVCRLPANPNIVGYRVSAIACRLSLVSRLALPVIFLFSCYIPLNKVVAVFPVVLAHRSNVHNLIDYPFVSIVARKF